MELILVVVYIQYKYIHLQEVYEVGSSESLRQLRITKSCHNATTSMMITLFLLWLALIHICYAFTKFPVRSGYSIWSFKSKGKSNDDSIDSRIKSSGSNKPMRYGQGRDVNQRIIDIFHINNQNSRSDYNNNQNTIGAMNNNNGKITSQQISALRDLLNEHAETFTYVHCLTILHRSARCGYDVTRLV